MRNALLILLITAANGYADCTKSPLDWPIRKGESVRELLTTVRKDLGSKGCNNLLEIFRPSDAEKDGEIFRKGLTECATRMSGLPQRAFGAQANAESWRFDGRLRAGRLIELEMKSESDNRYACPFPLLDVLKGPCSEGKCKESLLVPSKSDAQVKSVRLIVTPKKLQSGSKSVSSYDLEIELKEEMLPAISSYLSALEDGPTLLPKLRETMKNDKKLRLTRFLPEGWDTKDTRDSFAYAWQLFALNQTQPPQILPVENFSHPLWSLVETAYCEVGNTRFGDIVINYQKRLAGRVIWGDYVLFKASPVHLPVIARAAMSDNASKAVFPAREIRIYRRCK